MNRVKYEYIDLRCQTTSTNKVNFKKQPTFMKRLTFSLIL